MVPDNLRTALVAVSLGSLVLLSGLGMAGAVAAQQPSDVVQPSQSSATAADDATNGSSPSGEEIADRVEERVNSLDTLVVTHVSNTSMGENESITTERKMWIDNENDRVRTETETDTTEIVTVTNESASVTYNVEENTVSTFERSGDSPPMTPINAIVENTDLSYETTERVDGVKTHRLNAAPSEDGPMGDSAEMTVWVDADSYLPVKTTTLVENDEYGDFETTSRFQNVTVNEPIDDDRFSIDVPNDAEEPGHSFDRTTYDSLSEMQENVDSSISSVAVPEAFEFEQGTVMDSDDYRSVSARYASNDGTRLHVSEISGIEYEYSDMDMYDEIEVGDTTGYYAEYDFDEDTMVTLTIPCEDTAYSVGGGVTKEEATDIAESFDCE